MAQSLRSGPFTTIADILPGSWESDTRNFFLFTRADGLAGQTIRMEPARAKLVRSSQYILLGSQTTVSGINTSSSVPRMSARRNGMQPTKISSNGIDLSIPLTT